MTQKVIDSFVMKLIPEISTSDSKKMEKKYEKSLETSTQKAVAKGSFAGFKAGAKSFGKSLKSSIKSTKSAAAAIGGLIAAPIIVAEKKLQDTISSIQEQLDISDQLATRATQSGIALPKFLELQKLLEFGDVDASSASSAIIEFEKRLGQFQKQGRGKEFFAPLGITKNTDPEKAFLLAISAVQNASGAAKNAAADKFFGGFGTGALAEFLGGNLRTQAKAIQGIDFNKLADQVQKGSDQQSRITQATVQASIDKLLKTNLDATPIVQQIQGQAARDIKDSKNDVQSLVTANESLKKGINTLSNSILQLVNLATEFIEKFTGKKITNNNEISD